MEKKHKILARESNPEPPVREPKLKPLVASYPLPLVSTL